MKAFGIAALVISIIAIFVPLLGALLAGVAGVLAIFAAGQGTTLGLAAVLINLVNIVFLSPTLVIPAVQQSQMQVEGGFSVVLWGLLLVQGVAICVFVGKWWVAKSNKAITAWPIK